MSEMNGNGIGRKKTVLITGVGGRSVGGQILDALIGLQNRYRLVVTDANRFSFGLYQAENRYLLPPASSPEYLPAVTRLIKQEAIDIVLPGTQPEIAALAAHHESHGLPCALLANPAPVVALCHNKAHLYEWMGANGFAIPRTVGGTQWRSLARQVGWPLVAKPTEDTGGSRGVAILANESEVCAYLAGVDPGSVVFQEYVGTAEDEYTVGVMVSREGAIIDSLVLHRNLVGLTLGVSRDIEGERFALSTGYSQGYIVRHALIQETCERLALAIGLRGPANIQLRLHKGVPVVFEVHPRFSGTASIRAEARFNEPDTLIRNWLHGESFGRLDYRTDVAAIRAFRNVLVPRRDMAAVSLP